jgi:hypothetical protein
MDRTHMNAYALGFYEGRKSEGKGKLDNPYVQAVWQQLWSEGYAAGVWEAKASARAAKALAAEGSRSTGV